MLSTKNLITISEVPEVWIFETFLGIEKLHGQNVQFKSPFNPNDKNPSAYVYYAMEKGGYRFKDWSAGIECDAIELVQRLLSLPDRNSAANLILEKYKSYLKGGNTPEKREIDPETYEVFEHKLREWNTYDQKYWTAYNIGTSLLNKYQVKPLEHYRSAVITRNGRKEFFHGNREYIYGFFKTDGTLYKLYQPKIDPKFIKLVPWIHGMEQLTYKVQNLIINSSLKDMMSFESLGFKIFETIAPESENQMIPPTVMASLFGKYRNVFILMDNDKAGQEASVSYKQRYPALKVVDPSGMAKDVAESVKELGKRTTTLQLFEKIKTAFQT